MLSFKSITIITKELSLYSFKGTGNTDSVDKVIWKI